MLRVGLTGDLGSGKSTVARMFAERGGVVLSSDEMGRKLMQPGQPVYAAIVEHFGGTVVAEDGAFDRRVLARLAFTEGRVEELNAIVHPAVIAEQARLIKGLARKHPDAIVIVESALLFTTKYGNSSQPWRDRFDRMVLVTAPEEQKIARFVERAAAGRLLDPQERAALEADARARLAMQTANEAHAAECLVIQNNGDLVTLLQRVGVVWRELCQVARFEP
ncbi:dephospho-CoA kinase [Granulicella mallensis]|uniref:Dephospho-CoA kinase n=1 Tax=Granulicella mallensis TaxID=940614 RepID=A0A7W8E9R8_9BACT|nr:dephospho-CoA kinase [Granulicella mallensis]MBB5063991.1 dephospho-CoA kinase [Granulicella mallensis]